MAIQIQRREFITLGGAMVALPLVARAQQPDKTPRVGYIRGGTSNNDPYQEAFERGMRDLGYVEGRNIAFEFRHYGDDVGSIPSLISDLLRAKSTSSWPEADLWSAPRRQRHKPFLSS